MTNWFQFLNLFDSLPPGWLSFHEAILLASAASETPGDIIEIGCYRGRSTVLLDHHAKDRCVDLYCIDPFAGFDSDDPTGEKTKAQFLANTANAVYELWQRRVEDCVPIPAGLIYCDGDHTEQGTVEQIEFALACTRGIQGAMILIHDVNDSGDGLIIKRVCERMLGAWNRRVERLALWRINS